ncbi:MAG: MoaD/ThiS family protein [Dehalococcoidia bacterium]
MAQRDDLGIEAGSVELLLGAGMPEISVRLYAGLQGVVGARELMLSLPAGATIAQLRDRLVADHPMLEAFLPALACAVAEEMVPPEHILADGDVVEVIPPIAGG